MSCREHRFSWLSLSIRHYRPTYSAGPQDYILCLYTAVVDRFMPDVQHLSPLENVAFEQCPSCLVHLIWIILEMGGRWPYSCSFVGCCFQDLFNMAYSILVQLPSSLFFMLFVRVYVLHPYCSMNTTTDSKKLRFISSDRSDFHMTYSQSIADDIFARRVLMSFFVDEMLLPI